jgi:hypothetical protein
MADQTKQPKTGEQPKPTTQPKPGDPRTGGDGDRDGAAGEQPKR